MPLLVEGDEMRCWHCGAWHTMHRAAVPGPYPKPMLFITCRGGEYYAGNVGNPADQPVRTPPPH